jgi:hypothetical protein
MVFECLTASMHSYIVRARRTDGVTCTDTGTEGCAAAAR